MKGLTSDNTKKYLAILNSYNMGCMKLHNFPLKNSFMY